jgi:hypothetical protein
VASGPRRSPLYCGRRPGGHSRLTGSSDVACDPVSGSPPRSGPSTRDHPAASAFGSPSATHESLECSRAAPRDSTVPGYREAMVARSVFERLEASGFRELKVYLTEEARAHAFSAAVPAQFTASVGYGRATGAAPTNHGGPRVGSPSAGAALAMAEQSPKPLAESHWLGNRHVPGGVCASNGRVPRPRCSPWRVET